MGNGGAPLSGSVNYGYLLAQQSGTSVNFTAYDYSSGATLGSFSVH